MMIHDNDNNSANKDGNDNSSLAMNMNRNMPRSVVGFGNDKQTEEEEEEEDALLVQELQGRLSKTRWWLSLAVACNIVALLVAVLLMATTTSTTTIPNAATKISPFPFMASIQQQPQPQPTAVVSVRHRQLETPAVDPNDLEVTDTYKSAKTGQHMEDAMVTVEIEGTKYFGSDQGLINAHFHVNQDGCKVYENIRNDGRDAEVICCGPGDCLMGFLTRHQWLLSWL